jgi:hypothetical protein
MKLSEYFRNKRKSLLWLYLLGLTLLVLYSAFFFNAETLSYLEELILTPLQASDRLDGISHLFFNLMGLMPFLLLFAYWPERNCYSPKFWWFFPFSFVAGAFVIEPWLILREKRFESCQDKLPNGLRWLWLALFLLGLGGVASLTIPQANIAVFLRVLSTNSFYQVMSLDLVLFVVLTIYGLMRNKKDNSSYRN